MWTRKVYFLLVRQKSRNVSLFLSLVIIGCTELSVLLLGGGHPGDWWTALESEPSLGSTTQLHTPVTRGPEFAHTMLDTDGPYINVNKGKAIA